MATDLLRDTGRGRPASSVSSAGSRHPLRAPLLIGLFGFALTAIGIGTPSIWYDEVATVASATRSWAQLGAEIQTVDAVHAAYYGLMHLVFDVFGYSPLSLRMPSAMAIGLGAALIVVLVRQLSTNGHALVSGFVFLLIPRVAWMGTEGRSFALTTALGVAMTLALVIAVRTGLKRWWVAYVVLGALTTVVFVYAALLVVAHGVAMAWWWASDRGAVRLSVLRWAVAAASILVVVLPLVIAVVLQAGQVSWIDPIGEGTFRQVFRTQWYMYSWEFATVGWVLTAVGAVMLARRGRGRASGLSSVTLLLPLLLVPTAALLIVTLVYSPLYSPRYVSMTTPYAAILVAAAVAFLRPRLVGAVAFLLIAALAIGPFFRERGPQAKQESTWKEVAALIEDQRAEDGAASSIAMVYGPLWRHPRATSRVIAYSYPEPFAGTVDVTIDTPAAETGGLWETHRPLAASLDRLDGTDVAYLITSTSRDTRPETTALLGSVGWRLDEQWNLGHVNVLRYERVDAAD